MATDNISLPPWLVMNDATEARPAAEKPFGLPSWLVMHNPEYGITKTEQWPQLPDTTTTPKGKRSPMYQDAMTGVKGERQLGQFIPSSSHVPLPPKKKIFGTGGGTGATQIINGKKYTEMGGARDVTGTTGNAQQRAVHRDPAVDYLKGEMPHRSITNPKFWTENVPRSAVRAGAKGVMLAPLLAGGLPAFAGYASMQALNAALDTPEGKSKVSAAASDLYKQASDMGRMLTDPVNILERSPEATKEAGWWDSRRANYAWDSPGEALVDATFAKHVVEGAIKPTKWAWDAVKTKPNQEQFMRTVSDEMSKMAKGGQTGKKTPEQRKVYDRKAGEAFEFIFQNKDLFNVIDHEGQRIELPRNRIELAEFVDQGKRIAFAEYDHLREMSEGTGASVELSPVIEALQKVIEDPNYDTVEGKPIVAAATKKLAEYEERMTKNNGKYTLSQTQNAIKIANEKLAGMYRRGASYDDSVMAVIDKGVGDVLRTQLDKSIDSAEGPGYQEWKNKYGALKTIEEDVNSAANRLRNMPDMKVDFLDIYGVSKLALAVTKGDPTIAAAVGAGWLAKKFSKRWTPDPTIERTFKKLNKLVEEAPDNGFVGPEGTGVLRTPRELFMSSQGDPRKSLLLRPEDMEHSPTEPQTSIPIERGEQTPQGEYDPNLRDIEPEGPTDIVRPKILEDRFDVQYGANQSPRPDSQGTYARNLGKDVTSTPGDRLAGLGESVETHPQDVAPAKINAARAQMRQMGFPEDQIDDILNGMKKEVIPAPASSASEIIPKGMSKEEWISRANTTNPTGSLFVEYTPQERVKIPLGDNIQTLDKSIGGKPDDVITVYRGTPGNKINPGDFVSTNKQLAKDYAGTDNVVELKVRKGDVIDVVDEHGGEEFIYRPGADKEKVFTPSQLSSLYDEAKAQKAGTKETPLPPMYEGVTGVFLMLQGEVAKAGGKASGVAKVALKYGVPAALVARFLSGSYADMKMILAMPAMKGLRSINQRRVQ